MRVAYLISSLKKCGPNVVVYNLIEEMKNHHHVEIFYLDDNHHDDFFSTQNINKTKVNGVVDANFKLSNFDVVHSGGIRPDILALLIKVKNRNVKIISTIHNYVFQDLYYSYGIFKSIFFGLIWCFIWCFFDKVVVLSKEAKRYYWFIPKRKKHVIHNGIVCSPFTPSYVLNYRQEYNIPNSSILIGTCANITKRKGIDLVIKMLAYTDDIFFLIAGDGVEKESLLALVKSMRLDNKVLFLSHIDDPKEFMAQLDVYVMPSRSEGFGLTVIEATNVNTPVITSNIPIFKELFSYMTVFFDINDLFSLKENIFYVAKNKEELSKKFRAIMLSKYTSKIMSTKYEELYTNSIREQK
ncbi:MAG: glycosyltransferase family 4 protein [Aeromonas sp.]|uniref:glycosyltransferase family 4 protein n=1 Tax=Aeromonas caviae TaxID=648 RepID=UPI00290DD5E2|nr:glycosyltransferase family 4 protein [Aeromonas caviae]MDU7311106.1 glycosyltransferase family 4 protein [Aeromonas sp.]MDX7804318.1 glycosyltransferase family 4 protein [Aeromonas caviae]